MQILHFLFVFWIGKNVTWNFQVIVYYDTFYTCLFFSEI
jgi:hypothetical protein